MRIFAFVVGTCFSVVYVLFCSLALTFELRRAIYAYVSYVNFCFSVKSTKSPRECTDSSCARGAKTEGLQNREPPETGKGRGGKEETGKENIGEGEDERVERGIRQMAGKWVRRVVGLRGEGQLHLKPLGKADPVNAPQ